MNKDLIHSLAWAGGIVAVALIATLARNLGYIDQEMTTRAVIVATGLMIVAFGNRIPKTFTPSVCARQAQRVTAWSMVVSGLIYAAAFLLLPMDTAVLVGCGAVILGIGFSLGYCLMLRSRVAAG